MMTLSEVKAHLQRNGFTRINTAGGWVSLENWNPYGGCAVRFRHIDFDRRRIFETFPPAGLAAGVWEFGADPVLIHAEAQDELQARCL